MHFLFEFLCINSKLSIFWHTHNTFYKLLKYAYVFFLLWKYSRIVNNTCWKIYTMHAQIACIITLKVWEFIIKFLFRRLFELWCIRSSTTTNIMWRWMFPLVYLAIDVIKIGKRLLHLTWIYIMPCKLWLYFTKASGLITYYLLIQLYNYFK